MTNKGGSTKLKAIKLPPLPKLKVRRPNSHETNPCLILMNAVLTCWASNGYTSSGCQSLETQLRACMDAPKAPPKAKNNINHHLARFYPRIVGPVKRK